MADLASISGGSSVHHASLSAHEHQVAMQALEKLKATGGVSRGSSVALSSELRAAVGKPGTELIGKRTATFAGGASSGIKPAVSHIIGSDTVVAGSALTKSELTSKAGAAAATETIKIEGVTAALVKHEAAQTKSAAHTITMPDKTNITLSGISTHDLFKH
jgi:hypothetical protein